MRKTILILCLFLISSTYFAQKKAFEIEDLYKIQYVGAPVYSSAKDMVAFTVTKYNLKEGKSNTDIYVMKSDGSRLKGIINSEKSEYSPFFSPDGNSLYFMKSGQIYSYSFSSDSIEQLTDFSTGISEPVISPDGSMIAFTTDLYPECGVDNDCNDKLLKSSAEGPVQAYIADELLFRHWTEYKQEKETHIVLFNLKTKTYKDFAKSEWASQNFMLGGTTRYAFSPDGKELAFMQSPEKNLAVTTNSDIWIKSVDGSDAVNITKNNLSWDGYPVYSPDGKYIAFKLQEIPKYEADRYRLALFNRESKQVEIITEEFDFTIDDFKWSEDSQSIYFNAAFHGYSPLYKIDINSKRIEKVSSDLSIFGFEVLGGSNKAILNVRSIAKPAEIYSINFSDKSLSNLTNFNEEFLNEVDVRPAEQFWVKGADGIDVHVFLVKPHNFNPNKKYPLILNVHGGPQGQWMDSFRGDWQVYPGAGYVLAFANPHGSTGYGSKYTEEISGDWGGKVFVDLMKVTDHLTKLSYVDSTRMGAMGWSYGGYMMDWFQAKTKRFKCLASMMGIYDLPSMWGATEELWFVNWDLKGQPWNSSDYDKWSPSKYVKNFATPTLIITGEKDFRVPYTQSVQFFTTLQSLGIPSRLIIFKNDGHWPNYVKSMPLYYNSHLEWFNKYLGGAAAPYDSKKMVKNIAY